ncbi:MAG TPA: hypothetical protein VG034_15500 [Acidimicrobiia bacterium]|nr:hypothetical protein [Acidimicrobiia bacterium]
MALLATATSLLPPPVPGPPIGMGHDGTRELIFTVICALPLAVGLGWALKLLVKDRNPFLLLCMVGGATSTVVEPLLDINGGVWWPAGSWEAFHLAHINIPLLVPFVYPWLLGLQGYVAYRAFSARADVGAIWRLVGIFAAADILLEWSGLNLDVYAYYGTQPLKILGLPFWYVPLNAGGPLIAGAIFYLLKPHFRGPRIFALLGVFPMSFALMYFGCGWPMWLSLQSDWPIGTATVAAALTYGLSYLMLRMFMVATRTPGTEVSPEPAPADHATPDRPFVNA